MERLDLPVIVVYCYKCQYTGQTFRVHVHGVHSWEDEPYPPGGMLRVCRNAEGQAIAGPLVSELLSWDVV